MSFSNVGRKINKRYHSRYNLRALSFTWRSRATTTRTERAQSGSWLPIGTYGWWRGVEPTPYQLLTGSQIHQVQLWLRKMERAELKPEPTLAKELTFSSNIGQHDLDTKSKQIQQWIKKKYKVQITIKKGKNEGKPEKKKKMQETIESSRQCLLSSNFLIQALAH